MLSTFKRITHRVVDYIVHSVKRKRGILFYIGLHRGRSFRSIFNKYKICYGFEANPELFKVLQEEYRRFDNVRLFNVAVADHDGEIEFNISDNDGASSSIGHFDEAFSNNITGQVKIERTIRVPCINLYHFIETEGIDYIDDYISDIQGMDLEVLKTLKPLIQANRIGSISCEVAKDEKRNIYSDLPANNESGFNELLSENYALTAKGWGLLIDGKFDNVPEQWWEMDCKWRLRNE